VDLHSENGEVSAWYALAFSTWFVLKERVNPPACIARMRVLCLAADYFGQTIVPTPVEMLAGNPAFRQFCEERGGWPESAADWEAAAQAGGHCVSNGQGEDRPGKWGGHLIGLCGDWLLDPSGPDVTRPKWGVEVPPVAISGVGGRFRESAGAWAVLRNGCIVAYSPKPEASDRWMHAPDWVRVKRARSDVAAVIRLMRSAMAGRGPAAG